ncbi:MAG TPA: hypothetical protein VHV51_10685 [Polyangiaceae bacterium]|jgi:hypothetical protein|nr:hypothetical protein [Polyangiaceae bacterium]
MASESEPKNDSAESEAAPAAAATSAVSERPKKKKTKRPRPPIPRTEEEINSPTKQTLGMLGILCAMTVIMWGLARGACNYHPPKETRVPRKVTLADLAHDPKNAAIELEQRWLTHDFDGALELATGDVSDQIKKDKAACDPACLAQKPELASKVLTSAVVVDMNPAGTTVRATSVGLPGGPKSYYLRMQRADMIWKAVERNVDTGAPYVPPTAVPLESATPAITSAAASAAAAASAPAPHHAVPAPSASH